jgi:hypothetical protein
VTDRLAAVASKVVAVLAAAALLLVPVTATAGGEAPHPHAILQLLADGADGVLDHHHHHRHPDGVSHDHSHPGDGGSSVESARRRGALAAARSIGSEGDPTAAHHAAVGTGMSLGAALDDVPRVTAVSAAVVAAAMPVVGVVVGHLGHAAAGKLLAWPAPRIPAGARGRPLVPPPRVAGAA